ncbi:MAG: hypothetical protein J6N93_07785 [Clostridia bacterium]|nr:hypothetical protein [Clostridia bacterium]
MKKRSLRTLSAVLAAAALTGVTACGGGGGNGGGNNEPADSSKTQLLIWDYKAGYGDAWLTKLERDFEEQFKDYSFEEGKVGVQVKHEGDMKEFSATDVKDGQYDIYFTEGMDFRAMSNPAFGALEDLTSIVTGKSEFEDKTIYEKMTDLQKNFYGLNNGESGFYGIPHYEGGWGLSYDKDLFDERGYYLDVNGDVILDREGVELGYGPDGKKGTFDDGLPQTYDQFFNLCEEIYGQGDIPFCWSGMYATPYINQLYDTLVADYEGVEQMSLNLTFDGVATDLGTIDESGKFVLDAEPTTITFANGYELSRQAGKYYALEFIRKMVTSGTGWYNKDGMKPSFTHWDAQSSYLKSNTTFSDEKPMAMLVDGPWWEAEATEVFNNMAKRNSAYSKQNRNFSWMPLPKATADKIGQKSVYTDTMRAFICVKAGLKDGVKNAALKFAQFACTDRALVEFTQITGAQKALKYEMSEKDMSVLSPFAKSIAVFKENADGFDEISYNPNYIQNRKDLLPASGAYAASSTYTMPITAFVQTNPMSAVDYFKSMYTYSKAKSFWK